LKPGAVVALIVLVCAAAATFVSFSQATVKHVTIAEAMSMPGKAVQVPGGIVPGSVTFSLRGNQPELRFEITDLQGGTERMTVIYRKPRPEGFNSVTTVEAIGRFKDGVFNADVLLVKCPSKYRGRNGG